MRESDVASSLSILKTETLVDDADARQEETHAGQEESHAGHTNGSLLEYVFREDRFFLLLSVWLC